MRGKIAIAASLALVASLFGPISASNAALVTKTFTVTKSDGSAYPNVYVGLFGWDRQDKPIVSQIVQTNANGIASIQVDDNQFGSTYTSYSVQPGPNDFSHAPVSGSLVRGATETLSVRLKTANSKFLIRTSDDSAAPIGSILYYPASRQIVGGVEIRTLHTGAFGLDLSNSIRTTGKHLIQLYHDGAPGVFYNEFGLSRSETDGVSTHTLYTDTTNTNVLAPSLISGQNVFVLRFNGPNLRGQLKSSSGSTLSFTGDLRGSVTLTRASDQGELQDSHVAWATIESDGSFQARLDSVSAGKYFPVFKIGGSLDIPTFVGAPFYIDSNGNYSMSPSGPFTSANSFIYSANSPAPNNLLKIRAVHPETGLPLDANVDISEDSEIGWFWYGPGRASNGLASFQLREGVYTIFVSPTDAQLVQQEFSLIVDQGLYSIKDSSNQTIVANSNGVFETPLLKPNLLIKIVGIDDPSLIYEYFGVSVRQDNDDDGYSERWYYPVNGLIPLKLKDGEYPLTVRASGGMLANRDYTVVVSGSSVTLRDEITNTLVSPAGGVFSLTPATANVTMRLVDTSGQAVIPTSDFYVNSNLQRKVNGNWRYEPSSWIELQADGTLSFRAKVTGEYRVLINPQGRSDLSRTHVDFVVDNIRATKNLGDVTLKASNFKFRIVAPGSSDPIPYSYVYVQPITAVVSSSFDGNSYTGFEGEAGFAFDAVGTYKLNLQAPGEYPPNVVASKSYTVSVASNGSGGFTPSIVGLTPTNGVFTLPLGIPNVTGVLARSDGTAFQRSNSEWVNLSLQKFTDNSWQYTDYSSNVTNAGEFGFRVEENGTYRLRVSPYNIANAATTISESFIINDGNRDTVAKNFSSLRFAAPTAKMGILVPGSSSYLRNSYIEIAQVGQNQESRWVDSIETSQAGIAYFSALEAGDYDFTVNPDWQNLVGAVSKTYRGTVSGSGPGNYTLSIPGVTADANGVLGLSLATPNVTGRVVSSSGAALNFNNGGWVSISVQRFDSANNQWQWTNNRVSLKSDGRFAALVTEPGTYRLRLEPWELANQTLKVSGSFTITEANAATFSRNFGDITLSAPTLTGEVLAPSGTTKIPYSQISIFETSTGRELWEYSRQADRNGNWAITLPAGSYSLVARAPWRSVLYGDSLPLQNIVVAANGSVTIGGVSASANTQIRITSPTWSGTVVNPSNQQVLPNTSICFWHEEGQKPASSCTMSDDQGRWALSKMANFTGFNDSSRLTIHPRSATGLAEKRIEGATALTQTLGAYSANNSYSNIVLAPNVPNVSITVMAGQAKAANVWVDVRNQTSGWLGGATTDQNGIAKMYIPNLTGPIEINTYADWIPELSGSFANTRKQMTQAEVTSATNGSNFATTVSLANPNLKVISYKPGATPSTPGAVAGNSHVWVWNETDSEWAGSFSTDALGEGRMYLSPPASGTTRYRLTLEPSGANEDLNIRTVYYVDLQSNGNFTVTTASGSTVTAVGGKFPVVLTAATVKGEVTAPDGTTSISNSRIYPTDIETRMQVWESNAYSNHLGKFGMVLPNGSYWLVAEPAWGQSNLSRSERCQVDIFNGNVLTSNSSCVNNGQVKLKLRDSNVKFKLVHNGQPVKYAHVSFSVGNWYTSASSKEDGTVSLLVDPQDIAAQNPGLSGTQDIRVYVNPSYDSSGIVSWNCNSGDNLPLCNQLVDVVMGQNYSVGTNGQLLDVNFAQPNTKLRVSDASNATSYKRDSWVTVYKQETGWLRWVGDDNTNADGYAEFNLDSSLVSDSTARYTVHVNAPWSDRNSAARGVYRDLTYAQLNNGVFALSSPNLKIKVRQPITNRDSRWSWVSIQKKFVYQDPNWYWDWYDGVTTDEQGQAALALESPGTYLLTVYPGTGAKGAMVTCELSVTTVAGQTAISKVDNACNAGGNITNGELLLTLSAGNLQGTVTVSGTSTAVEGAIIFAEAMNDSNQLISGKTMEAVSSGDGTYGLQLSADYNWRVRVFYVNAPGASPRLSSILTPVTVTKAELIANKTLNLSLATQ